MDDNLLDLVFSSLDYINVTYEPSCIVSIDSYHPPLSFCINGVFSPATTTQHVFYLDFKAANYDAIIAFLNGVPWEALLDLRELNAAVSLFHDIIYFAIETLVPHKLKKLDTFPIWFNGILKNLIY